MPAVAKTLNQRHPAAYAALAFALILQMAFWWQTKEIRPDMEIVPDVPGETAVKALAFGDEQFFFRILALQMQTAGDTFGRFTALYKYDFNKLSRWFALLDKLDNTSNMIPVLATYYYSQTQHKSDVRYIVNYLYNYAAPRPDQKWWWLVQAIYLAGHKLEDKDLALKMALPLKDAKNVPLWVNQMPAFVYEQRGEKEAAVAIIENLLKNSQGLTDKDLAFMKYFIEDRLGLDEKKNRATKKE